MILRPSGAGLWGVCAANPSLAVPDDVDTDDDTETRDEGIACHWAAATGAPEGVTAPNGIEIDAEMMDAVSLWWQTLRQWSAPVVIETPVHCAGIHEILRGTPDAMGYDPVTFTLYLADLKYGYRYVTEIRNKQLLCYMDGAWRYFGKPPVARIVFTIVQPRCYSASGPVRTWECMPHEVETDIAALMLAAHNAMQPNPRGTLNPGCRSCSGRHQCETIRTASGAIADASGSATPTDLPFAAQEYELRYVTDAIDVLTAYQTGLQQQVAFTIKKGQRSKYYEIATELTPLKWNADTTEKVRSVARMMGVSVDKPSQIITPTQAKAVLGENVVGLFAQRLNKAPKLRPVDAEKWRKMFDKRM